MIYPVIDWEIDEAGKYRFRVDIDGSTVMFKYDSLPDDQQVQDDAARYVELKNQISLSETGE